MHRRVCPAGRHFKVILLQLSSIPVHLVFLHLTQITDHSYQRRVYPKAELTLKVELTLADIRPANQLHRLPPEHWKIPGITQRLLARILSVFEL